MILPACHSFTASKIVRTDTFAEVDFITVDMSRMEFSLFTKDLDQTLRENTVEFSLVVDVSDGITLGAVLCTFTVEFIGDNNLPYFNPELGSYWQIYK